MRKGGKAEKSGLFKIFKGICSQKGLTLTRGRGYATS